MSRTLSFISAGLSLAIAGQINPSMAESLQKQDTQLDTVIVQGQEARLKRQALQSAKPVDIITSETIQKSGATSVQDLLLRALPSANWPQGEQSFNAIGKAQGIALRGLSPGQTLILVNGKRQHNSAFVHTSTNLGRGDQITDITTIPLNAIDYIEVLRDGAATQYGADGLAGVINLVLRKSPDGGGALAEYGGFEKGDGRSKVARVWKGFSLPGDGALTLSYATNHKEKTDPTARDPRQWYFAGDPREQTSDHRWYGKQGSPYISENIFAFNADSHLNEQVQWYGFGNYYDSHKRSAYAFVRPLEDTNNRSWTPDGFHPEPVVEQLDFQVSTGLKIDAAALGQFDLSYSYGKNEYDHWQTHSPNTTVPYWTGDSYFNGSKSLLEHTLDLHWSKTLATPWLGSRQTRLLGGLGYLKNEADVRAGEVLSWYYGDALIADGPNAGKRVPRSPYGVPYGIRPEDAGSLEREKASFYLSVQNQWSRLSTDIGARVEHFDDLGETALTGNLSARYELDGGLALRGNLNRGARAPGLQQLLTASTTLTTDTVSNLDYRSKFLRSDDPLLKQLGGKDLELETSKGLSLGVVYAPAAKPWSLTLDLYQTRIDGRITQTETLSGSSVQALLNNLGYTDITGVSFFQNAVDTKTTGLDLTASHAFDFADWGNGNLSLNYGRNKTEVTGRQHNARLPNLTLIGAAAISRIEDFAPEDKLVLSYSHTLRNVDATLTATRYGKYTYAANAVVATSDGPPSFEQTFSPQWVANLQLGYRPIDSLRLSLGVKNLFDSYPDKAKYIQNNGVTLYSALSPEGGEGRYFYTSLAYDF